MEEQAKWYELRKTHDRKQKMVSTNTSYCSDLFGEMQLNRLLYFTFPRKWFLLWNNTQIVGEVFIWLSFGGLWFTKMLPLRFVLKKKKKVNKSLTFIGVQKWCVYAGVCLHEHTHDCLALLGDQMEAWWVVLHATAGGEGAIIGGLRLCQPPVCVSHTHTHLTRTHVHTSAHCDPPPPL